MTDVIESDLPRQSLTARHNALTRELIVQAGVRALQAGGLRDVTVRAVATDAGVAERTVFRHFATRDQLLDGLAAEVSRQLQLPPLPGQAADLADMPDALYRAFEAQAALVRAALHSELFERMREGVARARWATILQLIDAAVPQAPRRQRQLAAANIRYMLAATTWQYYRFFFGFSLGESVAAARQVVTQALNGLGIFTPPAAERPARTRQGQPR